MIHAKKLLGLLALIGFVGFFITSVLAQSPSVTVLPATIPEGGATTITITAAVTNTVVTSISVSGPPGNPGPWTWSGVPITMPDVGDAVSITFPGGVFTIVNDPNGNIVGGPGAWSAGANTGTTGEYWVTVRGTETSDTVTKRFVVQQEFNVPQFALGTTLATAIGFIGVTLIRRRLKKT